MPDLAIIIVTAAISVVSTIVGRKIWDRYLSENSRVPAKLCEQYRKEIAGCLDGLKESIEKRLDTGDSTFEKVSICLSVSMHVILDLCKEVGMDCTDIKNKLIEKGVLR